MMFKRSSINNDTNRGDMDEDVVVLTETNLSKTSGRRDIKTMASRRSIPIFSKRHSSVGSGNGYKSSLIAMM